jgi:uncharacterized protein YqeY
LQKQKQRSRGFCRTRNCNLAKNDKTAQRFSSTICCSKQSRLGRSRRSTNEGNRKFLPAQLSSEELEAEIKKIIAEVGAESLKDLGKVMGTASKL